MTSTTKYALGSVLEHALVHLSVIGFETLEQLALAGAQPDVVLDCIGGGSNFAGFVYPFLRDKLKAGGKGPCNHPRLTGSAASCRVAFCQPKR